MLARYSGEIERLVFVCPNIEKAFLDERWNRFVVTPVRQTRPFLCSRFVVFRNLLLEFLQVTDVTYGEQFALFEEWKKATQPFWTAIGLRVKDLGESIAFYKKLGIETGELFIRKDTLYTKGFSHSSALLMHKIENRTVYITEYDKAYLSKRNDQFYHSLTTHPNLMLPSINFDPRDIHDLQKGIRLEGDYRLHLYFSNSMGTDQICDFGWLSCHFLDN